MYCTLEQFLDQMPYDLAKMKAKDTAAAEIITRNGSIASGSDTVTGLSATSDIMVGAIATTTPSVLPENTTVIEILSSSSVKLSAVSTALFTTSPIVFDNWAVRITNAINAAGYEIDTYLSQRYTLPLSSTPEVISKICVDIAVYNLYTRKSLDKEKDYGIVSRWERAIVLLKEIRDGKLNLSIAGVETEPVNSGCAILSDDVERYFL